LIVLSAAILGYLLSKKQPHLFATQSTHQGKQKHYGAALIDDDTPPPAHAIFRWTQLTKILVIAALLWCIPMISLTLSLGWQHAYTQMAWFFTKAALLTFGGAYAVLPYVYQGAVNHSWLSPTQMIDGLALGESTPGPLIMVVAFVGFVGALIMPC
jgi:chromate transporter